MASKKRLSATITIGGSLSSSLKFALGSAKTGLDQLGKAVQSLEKRQSLLGRSIQEFGRLGKNVDGMRNRYAELTAQLDRARKAQEKLAKAQERHQKLTSIGGSLKSAGVTASITGAAIGAPLVMGTKEAKKYETEQARVVALGMGDETNRAAFEFAKNMKTFGTSQLDNLTLVRDAMAVFGDLHHAEMVAPLLAKMKFGNAAFFGTEEGHKNEEKFMDMLKVIELRGGLKSEDEFKAQANMVQRVISATGGRVGPDEWRHMIATGGLAAKSMRDDAFFYQMEPLVQEMGGDRVGTGLMSGYSALYQGRTTKRAANNLEDLGLIADPSKVVEDKAGQIKYINPGALKGAELFRQSQFEWLKQVLLPTLAEKGLTSKDQVLDAIGSIYSNRKAADLMAAMYLQMDNIDKNARVNAGAADIDTIDKAGREMAAGKELAAEAKLADLKLRVGKSILPLYSRALETAADALDRLNVFAEKNPRLTKTIIVGLAGVSVALVTLGPLLLMAGTALAAYAGYSLLMTKFGIAGGGAFTAVGNALKFVGKSLLWIGRALLMNPIGLTITAIAVGAYLIYENWDAVKKFFIDVWDSVTTTFNNAWAQIKELIGFDPTKTIANAWDGTKTYFTNLWNDITGTVRDSIQWITAKIDWVGEKWRKTKEFFGFGDDKAKEVGQSDAPPEWMKTTAALPQIAPINGGGGRTYQDNSQNYFQLTQQPGENQEQFARRVAQEMERQRQIRERAALSDGAYAQ